MSDFKELEFKYNAESVKLPQFTNLMKELKYDKFIEVSSPDYYYTNDNDEFIRFRNSPTKPELTIKRKTNTLNNQNRIEVNVPLAPGTTLETITAFCELLGFKLNFNVYKTCFIYFFDLVDIVYYSVYNENMKEEGRFIEIEFLEDKLKGLTPEAAFDTLKQYEQKLDVLGISAQNRMKKSLYEIFKK